MTHQPGSGGFEQEDVYYEEYGETNWEEPLAEPPVKKRTIFKPRLTKPNFVLSVLVNAVRMLMVLVLLCGLALGGAVLGIAKGYMETAPTLDLALLDDQDKTSFLYDAQGNVITDYKGTENRIMVNISYMPENLRNAFVAVEDARFYTHNGIDIKRIIGSFVQNFVSGSQQGGSTITQQLIKNTVLSNELSYKRKIQEAWLALQLETRYTKLQILEYYLNTIYLGENYYGVQVAAQGYFGKELHELTLRECAMLAGLPPIPTTTTPGATSLPALRKPPIIPPSPTTAPITCCAACMKTSSSPSSSIRMRSSPQPPPCWNSPPPRATACMNTRTMWNMPCRTLWTASWS